MGLSLPGEWGPRRPNPGHSESSYFPWLVWRDQGHGVISPWPHATDCPLKYPPEREIVRYFPVYCDCYIPIAAKRENLENKKTYQQYPNDTKFITAFALMIHMSIVPLYQTLGLF